MKLVTIALVVALSVLSALWGAASNNRINEPRDNSDQSPRPVSEDRAANAELKTLSTNARALLAINVLKSGFDRQNGNRFVLNLGATEVECSRKKKNRKSKKPRIITESGILEITFGKISGKATLRRKEDKRGGVTFEFRMSSPMKIEVYWKRFKRGAFNKTELSDFTKLFTELKKNEGFNKLNVRKVRAVVSEGRSNGSPGTECALTEKYRKKIIKIVRKKFAAYWKKYVQLSLDSILYPEPPN